VKKDFGKIDIMVHSLANGPEVTKPLLETSRNVSHTVTQSHTLSPHQALSL
jgi:enoyl-[acyl-carrier-protein] reductase (NADH)